MGLRHDPIYAFVSNPTITDDSSSGYKIGDDWKNTSTGELWMCIDNSVGAAEWKSLTSVLTNPSVAPTLRNITTTDTFSTPNDTLNCTSGTFTVNLPTAVGIQGVVYTLVNSGTGIITLDGNGTETINGSTDIPLNTQESRTVQSDGSNWLIK